MIKLFSIVIITFLSFGCRETANTNEGYHKIDLEKTEFVKPTVVYKEFRTDSINYIRVKIDTLYYSQGALKLKFSDLSFEKYFFENQETFINNGTHIIDNDSSNKKTVKFLLNLFKRKEYKLNFTNVGERSVTEGSDW